MLGDNEIVGVCIKIGEAEPKENPRWGQIGADDGKIDFSQPV
jgi:hypothetical protein